MSSYPRATKEIVPLAVTRDGVTSSTFQVCVLPYGQVATDAGPWVTPTTADGVTGPLIDHLAVGAYTIWVRVTANPEVPVIRCGDITVV